MRPHSKKVLWESFQSIAQVLESIWLQMFSHLSFDGNLIETIYVPVVIYIS